MMAHPMPQSLYVIDGLYQIFRAYYAPFSRLTSPSGEPTKAVHAFVATLFNLLRNRRPDYLAMVLDVSDETVFRRELDPQYKAHRDPPPEDFAPQMDRIIAIVNAMGIPIYSMPRFEADDLMATIAERHGHNNLTVFLVSTDKDLEQLITDNVLLYDASKDAVLDAAALQTKKGYWPQQAVEIQTLAGDSVDNIPGVPGIGVKTAAKLIQKYGTAQAVLDHADELTPKMKENVRAFVDKIELTRQLVTLRRDVPFDFDLQAARYQGIAVDRVRPLFDELGFNRLTEQLPTFARPPDRDPSDATHESSIAAPVIDAPMQRTEHPGSKTDYRLVDTPQELERFANLLSRQKRFAFDTETTGLNAVACDLVGISISWQAGTGFYIPVRAAVGESLPLNVVVDRLKPAFENPAIGKCAHHLKFDLVVLRQAGINVRGLWFDSMIASFLLEPLRASHGLKQLGSEILGIEMTPIRDLIGRGKDQIPIDQVPSDRVCDYACADADVTWQLCEHFADQIQSHHVRALFEDVEMPVVEVLAEMEHQGVSIDTKILAKMSDALADRMHELTRSIIDKAGHTFNIDSTRQLATVLFDEQGLQVVRRTKTGRSTDADTLTTLASTSNNPIPPLLLEYRELTKLKGTYVDTLPQMIVSRTNRIHASFHQTGAVTGRLSSSDPNLQNIPIRSDLGRQIRRAFVPAQPDDVLLTADYSQIELRVLAHFSADQALRRAFIEGQDIHVAVAAQVNAVAVDDVTKEQRSAAKAVNFGIIYGQTPFGLARSLSIPVAEARDFIDTYFNRYPGIRGFIDRTIADARDRGFVETILGRRRPVPELHSRNRQQVAFGERIAVNTVIQGSAADLIKRAMIDIHRGIQADRRPTGLLIQVHDELVFETSRKDVETEAAFIRDKMCNAIPLDVPVGVDIAWGSNWLEGK